MKNATLNAGLLVLSIACLLGTGRSARGTLISSFNLSQGVYADPPNTITEVMDTALPYNQTVSRNTQTGGIITTTYNAYDNGSSGGLSINTSASLTALNNGVAEQTIGTPNSGATSFIFNQPVYYSFSLSNSGAGGEGDCELDAPSGHLVNIFQFNPNTTYQYSGILSADVAYALVESWGISNLQSGQPANLSGSESITLTFTPIPEPSSVAMLLLSAAAALCRRRVRTVAS